jgi:hypothetical protein
VLNLTPNGAGAGIWQSGAGPASDSTGNIYFVTGNGTFDADLGGQAFGDSFVKFTPGASSPTVVDFFTPFNQADMDAVDHDLGAGIVGADGSGKPCRPEPGDNDICFKIPVRRC